MGLILEISSCEAVDVLCKFEVIWAEEAKSATAVHLLKELFLLCKSDIPSWLGTQRVASSFAHSPVPQKYLNDDHRPIHL